MTFTHKGIRPTYDLVLLDFKRKIYCEEYPNGDYRIWNKRMLKSGCNVVTKTVREMMDCYYCATCDEWFNKEQWQ